MKETVINNTYVLILELYVLGLTNKMYNAIILLIHSFCELYNRIVHRTLFKVVYNNAIFLKFPHISLLKFILTLQKN